MELGELHTYLQTSVGKLKSCNSLYELRGSFVGVIFPFGFQQFAYTRFSGEDILPDHSVYTYAQEWTEIYLGSNFHEIDPISIRANRESESFFWSADDYVDDIDLTSFFSQAGEFGLNWGVTTPLKTSQNAHAILTCSASSLSNCPEGMNEIQLVTCCRVLSEVFHQCALSISDGNAMELRPREREVLALSAFGMSGNEIATVLGISPIYVSEVSRNMIQKFGVRNKLAALWRANELGLLSEKNDP
ncbi:MAG: autoinducer binding domain-containing protein [Hyphomicrobiales bacterium]